MGEPACISLSEPYIINPTTCTMDYHSIAEPFHKGFMSSQLKSCKNSLHYNPDSDNPMSSQICTFHNSSAVVTCAKLWPDRIIIFSVKATWFLTRLGLWAHKSWWNGSLTHCHEWRKAYNKGQCCLQWQKCPTMIPFLPLFIWCVL